MQTTSFFIFLFLLYLLHNSHYGIWREKKTYHTLSTYRRVEAHLTLRVLFWLSMTYEHYTTLKFRITIL